ncbi:MAG: SAVED domain-containing protein [Acidobacteriota bacterium]|nr:SAVED domain-containing protein [Acidobacteriota bacterium]
MPARIKNKRETPRPHKRNPHNPYTDETSGGPREPQDPPGAQTSPVTATIPPPVEDRCDTVDEPCNPREPQQQPGAQQSPTIALVPPTGVSSNPDTQPEASPQLRDEPARKHHGHGAKHHQKSTRPNSPSAPEPEFEPLEYVDFRLEIRREPNGTYVAELQAPAGREQARLDDLPCDTTEMERKLKSLWDELRQRVAAEGRAGERPDVARHHAEDLARQVDHQFGSPLFGAAFRDRILRAFENSESMLRGDASNRPRGLRIRLLVGARSSNLQLDGDTRLAEDLQRIGSQPWEYLYRNEVGQLLGRLACSRRTPLVRSLDMPYFMAPPPVDGPLRILVVDCVPADQNRLATEKERRELRAAIENTDVANVTLLTDPDSSELRRKLLRVRPHILHFIGHGGFDGDHGNGYLCLVGEDDKTERLSADALGQMLHEIPSLRLVFLNSCRTAQFPRRNGQDPWMATAAAVLRAGIPAVIAMQFPISDLAAIAFSTAFYQALVEGDPLEAAVAEGRIEIQRRSPWEWGIPVLYLNAENGKLFRFEPPATTDHPFRDGEETAEPLKLGIRSILGYGQDMKGRVHQMLALESYFDGRYISAPELWRERVAPKLSRFLKRWVEGGRPVDLEIAAHQSLAFLTGYLIEAKSGVPLTLTVVQRSEGRSPTHWAMNEGDVPPAPLWTIEEKNLGTAEGDVAVAIGITRPVLADVEDYLRSHNIPAGRLLSLSLPKGPGQTVVRSGAHAAALAQGAANLIDSRTAAEKRRTLHLLGAAPNAFFLYLGTKARGFGTIQLYEYEFEKVENRSYQPSLLLPLEPA